jgi:hypothetical protein
MTLQQNTDHIQTTHIGSLRRPHNTNPSLAAAFIDRILNCARPRDLPARGSGLGGWALIHFESPLDGRYGAKWITSHWPLARAGCPVGWLPSVPLPANSVSPRGREFPLLLDASPVLEVRFWLSTYSPRFRRSQTLLAKFLQDGFAQQFGIVSTGFCERDNSLGNYFRGEVATSASVLFQTGTTGTFVNQAGGVASSATDSGVRGANGNITVRNECEDHLQLRCFSREILCRCILS